MTETQPHDFTATQLVAAYADGSLSPVEVTAALLERSDALNPRINAFYHVDPEGALDAARASEARWARGAPAGLIDGVPVTIKDSVAVAGMPMIRGSNAYKSRPGPTADAPPTARVRDHGGVILAKTTMPDLGLLGASISSAYGITRNPWDLNYSASGSSSGAAASLAARIGPLSIGSDLGGSVRLPAAFCGLSTIKPTQGQIPHLPPSATRSAGPIARDMTDTALFLSVLSGPDPMDFGSLPPKQTLFHTLLNTDISGWTIGILSDIGGGATVEPVILDALDSAAKRFEQAGAKVSRIPTVIDYAFTEDLRLIFGSRGLAEVSNMTKAERARLLPVVNATVSGAENVSALAFIQASDRIEGAKKKLVAATYPYDVVLAPTSTVVNFPADQVGPNPEDWLSFTAFTSLFNQTGQPATVTCAGFDDRGLPFGLQFIGKRFDDLKTLQAAHYYEINRGFDIAWPDLGA